MLKRLGLVALAAGVALRRQGQERRGGRPPPPVEHIEMDPIRIAAVKRPGRRPPGDLRRRRAVRARRQGAGREALRRRDRAATSCCSRSSPAQRSTKLPSPLQRGLAHQGEEGLGDGRRDGSRRWATETPDSPDTKDAHVPARRHLRRDGELADVGDDLRAAARAQGHERRRQDRGDGAARASRSSSSRTSTPPSGRSRRRSTSSAASRRRSACRPTSTWAWSSTTWARSPTSASGRCRCGCPRSRWPQDMDDKARLLLSAQRQYIETIKLGNPQWASASGYQVGSLYEEFYDSFVHAPVPPELMGDGQRRRSARSTTRSCARRSASCWRSRCAPTSRTC